MWDGHVNRAHTCKVGVRGTRPQSGCRETADFPPYPTWGMKRNVV